MARIMYPFSQAALERRELEVQASKPKKQWKPQGFFRRGQIPPREQRLRTDNYRLWLQALLYRGPRPAAEVLKLAVEEGFSVWGVRRAKQHFGIKAVRVGGIAYRGCWMWQFPAASTSQR
jgi:hypothetical protein